MDIFEKSGDTLMISRNSWVSSDDMIFVDRDEMIKSAKDRFDLQRYKSSEGEDVVVVNNYYEYDATSKTRVVIQAHKNPYNENREDRKIFFDYETEVKRGSYVIWEDKWWLTLTKVEGNHAYRHATISECNNMLKWYDRLGRLHAFPCIFYPQSKANSFDYNQSIDTINALCKIEVQYNEFTNEIKASDRFILNGLAYQVSSVNKHKMNDCFDPNSVSTILFDLSVCVTQKDDDLVNNIANVDKYKYILSIEENDFECTTNTSSTLSWNVKLGESVVDIPVEFKSSDNEIVEVSDNGYYKAHKDGVATITCNIKCNTDVNDTVKITVGKASSDVVSIRLLPNETKILQGESNTYEVARYINESKTDYELHIEDVSTLDKSYYDVTTDINTFTLKNNKKSNKKVKIRCCDTYGNSEIFEFTLGGAW